MAIDVAFPKPAAVETLVNGQGMFRFHQNEHANVLIRGERLRITASVPTR